MKGEVAPRQTGAFVWTADEMRHRQEGWSVHLTDRQIAEIVDAAARFAHGSDDLPPITADEFLLPTLDGQLDSMRVALLQGPGFVLLRGLPVAELEPRQAAAAFLGIGAHLGVARSQNAQGHLLGHVRNDGSDVHDPSVRIYRTTERQTFHTDSCDVVALLCLETAASGGTSLLASAATIYNEMLQRSPKLASVLFEPIATDRRGEVPPGSQPWFEIPVLTWFEGALTVMYQRQYIDSAQRFARVPRNSALVVEALDLFDEIANDARVHLAMELELGDMQFVYNHSLLHDRTGFEDKPGSPRHLLRLWLSVPGDRRLPPVFAQRYGSIEPGDRGGIIVEGTAVHAPLHTSW